MGGGPMPSLPEVEPKVLTPQMTTGKASFRPDMPTLDLSASTSGGVSGSTMNQTWPVTPGTSLDGLSQKDVRSMPPAVAKLLQPMAMEANGAMNSQGLAHQICSLLECTRTKIA